ncbi:hypothetical protein [Bradyrhizobium tropiciagri]|uniref:hypothetical protein n=1 Tax=Bradyrhizobium tropiciagri TaxID=312253 RepID=UPI0012FE970F|nr:hypothetical protein [Bradyrhizobium tropiciagri]
MMFEHVFCDYCEEDYAPEELAVLAPPTGDGKLICARCLEIKLRRAIAELEHKN